MQIKMKMMMKMMKTVLTEQYPLISRKPRFGGVRPGVLLLAALCAVSFLAGCHKKIPVKTTKSKITPATASNPAASQVVLPTAPNLTPPPPPVRTPSMDWLTARIKNAKGLVDYARTVKPVPPEISVIDDGASLNMVPVLLAKNPTPTQLQVPLDKGYYTLGAMVALPDESQSPVLFYVNQVGADRQRHRVKTVKLKPGDSVPVTATIVTEEAGGQLVLAVELNENSTSTLGAQVTLSKLSVTGAPVR